MATVAAAAAVSATEAEAAAEASPLLEVGVVVFGGPLVVLKGVTA